VNKWDLESRSSTTELGPECGRKNLLDARAFLAPISRSLNPRGDQRALTF